MGYIRIIYNPLNLLLTSWDIQAVVGFAAKIANLPSEQKS